MTSSLRTLPNLGRLIAPLAALLMTTLGWIAVGGPVAAQESYGVRPGDVLRIEVLEDSTLNRAVLVTPDGRITFPQAGSLRVSGRSVDTIQRDLTNRLADSFAATPNVFVSIEQLAEQRETGLLAAPATISVFVVGEANTTGELEVSPGTTVLQMFGVMQGFTRFAATKRIQLRRTDPRTHAQTVYKLNYDAIEAGSTRNGQATLMDGDVIVVPQRRLFE